MSVNSVLNYSSMEELRNKIVENDWLQKLEALYGVYLGCQSLTDKQTTFNDIFTQYPVLSEDARVDLVHLCHTIWGEEHAELNWSLRNLSREHMQFLTERHIEMEGWCSGVQGHNGCWGRTNDTICREWYKIYPLARFLAEGCQNQREVLAALINWEMKNFFHFYNHSEDENWGVELYESDVPPDVEFAYSYWIVPLEAYHMQINQE